MHALLAKMTMTKIHQQNVLSVLPACTHQSDHSAIVVAQLALKVNTVLQQLQRALHAPQGNIKSQLHSPIAMCVSQAQSQTPSTQSAPPRAPLVKLGKCRRYLRCHVRHVCLDNIRVAQDRLAARFVVLVPLLDSSVL